jgi:hypothetical protein
MTSFSFSISRFTYVPDEEFPNVEAAYTSKGVAEWITVMPHSLLTLVLDQRRDTVIMKCLDGKDIRVSLL